MKKEELLQKYGENCMQLENLQLASQQIKRDNEDLRKQMATLERAAKNPKPSDAAT